jgi:hypothetical protein
MKVVATLVSAILCCSTFVAGKADHKADHKEVARHLQKRFTGHATYYAVGLVSTPVAIRVGRRGICASVPDSGQYAQTLRSPFAIWPTLTTGV